MTQSISTGHSTYRLCAIPNRTRKKYTRNARNFLVWSKASKGRAQFFSDQILTKYVRRTTYVLVQSPSILEPLHSKLEFLKKCKIWELELFFVMSSILCNLQHLLTNKKIPLKSFLFVHTTLFEVVN